MQVSGPFFIDLGKKQSNRQKQSQTKWVLEEITHLISSYATES